MALIKYFSSRYAGTIIATAITAGLIPILGVTMERLVPEGALAYVLAMAVTVFIVMGVALFFASWFQRRRRTDYFKQMPGDKPRYRALVASIGHLNPQIANEPSLTSQLAGNLLRSGEDVFIYLVGVTTPETEQMRRKIEQEFEEGIIPGVTARFVKFLPFENSANGIEALLERVGEVLEELHDQHEVSREDVVLDYTGGVASITSGLVQCGVKYGVDMHYYFNPENYRRKGATTGESILSRVRRGETSEA